MPFADAQEWMKKFAKKSYAKKGDDVVKMNYDAIDQGAAGLVEIPVKAEWANLEVKSLHKSTGDEYFDTFVNPINMLDGYDLPVSRFTKDNLLDGSMRNNVAFQEKRSIADRVPVWHKENCIQCNQCAFVCPHATIRPFLINEAEMAKMPEYAKDDVLDAMGGPQAKGLKFRIQVSPRNCVGCGLCVTECPGKPVKQADGTIVKQKALVMEEAKSQFFNEEGADYLYKNIEYKTGGAPVTSVKGAAFLMPYQEVSGACAGCGETPYYRLATQLFGKDMLIANTTGCSSIYNSSTPLSPFCTDKNGEGVAWANSLFEDNAEFGYGMRIATNYKLAEICRIFDENKDAVEPELKSLIEDYEANIKNREHVREIKDKLIELVEKSACEGVKEVLKLKGDLLDKSVWIIGGDGWSYDIGYGGLDHVIANEEDVNILVLDTEVYSNTGGQSSKSSQTGSIAKFTASGKKTAKKFLALIAMTYGHVYVAQVAMGGNKLQAIKALKEAESYNGPSLIICYAPCVNHGIKGGMANAQLTEQKAVECGYFPIFRYDPRLKAEGKDPLTIDCPTPDWSKFRDFLLCETRYSQLPKVNPEHCEELLTKCEKYAQDRWNKLQKFHEVVEEK
jgi:pyruvate-ferredoxin/flavodoxin oxidoreductase